MTIAHKNLTGTDLHEPKGVAAATANKVYISDGAGSGAWTATSSFNPFGAALLHVRYVYQSPAGVETVNPTYTTRLINTTLTNEITGAILASNQITLPAGTYHIDATVPQELQEPGAGNQAAGVTILKNVTAGTMLAQSRHDWLIVNSSVSRIQVHQPLRGRFTLAVTSVLEIQSAAFRAQPGSHDVRSIMNALSPLPDNLGADVMIWKTV